MTNLLLYFPGVPAQATRGTIPASFLSVSSVQLGANISIILIF